MFSQDDESQQGLVLTVVFGLVAVVLMLVIGVAVRQAGLNFGPAATQLAVAPLAAKTAAPVLAPAPVPASAAAIAGASQTAADAASVQIERGVLRFYFASGSAGLAAGATDALTSVLADAKAGRTLVVSGFHDASGNAAKNIELAKERALAVKAALKAAGVPDKQIELKKPEQTAGNGDSAEARRVDITLQ